MAGFDNDVMFASNVDFTGNAAVTAQVTADGQLLIGATASPNIRVGSLASSGGTITITVGAGTINLETAGSGGLLWSETSGAFAAAAGNGYIITNTATATLPTAQPVGTTIAFIVNTTNALTIDAGGTELIRVGTVVSSAGGTCTSTARGDSIVLVYGTTDTQWASLSGAQGTWVLA